MKNKLKMYIYFYIIMLLLCFLWQKFSPFDVSLTISTFQYFLAFLLLIIFNIISPFKDKLFPKYVLKIIQFLLVIFLLIEFYFTNFKNTPILQARFQNDPYEMHSRVIRDGVNIRLNDNSLKIKRYPFFINENDTLNFMKKNKKEVLILGSDKVVNLFFRKKNNFSFSILNSAFKDNDLIIIDDIQKLTIPYNPKKATVTFISNLLYKLKDDEFKLKQIDMQQFIWENSSHKAYPLFLLGNYNLKNYIKSQNKVYLNCAINNYISALGYIRAKENPQTFYATVNNLMISYYAKYLATTKIKYKKLATIMFNKNFSLKHNVKMNVPLEMKQIFFENRIRIKGA